MTEPRKYRAQPIDPTQAEPDGFVYGWYTKAYTESSNYRKIGLHINWIKEGLPYEVKVHPHTLGQDTGWKDKNGKAVWGGQDIAGKNKCAMGDSEFTDVKGEVVWCKGTLSWHLAGIYTKTGRTCYHHLTNINDIESIHDKEAANG